MAADIGLLSVTQLQKLDHGMAEAQQQPNPSMDAGSWMWNARQAKVDDDSWEVRAFAEDTANIMDTTWPPRSYTCTFCRREFRSAQALGGHMNVHRRDRARLRQSPPGSATNPSSSFTSSSPIIPTQEFVPNGGYCLIYPLANPSNVYTSTEANGCMESPSTLLSISQYPSSNLVSTCPSSINFPVATDIQNSLCHYGKKEPTSTISNDKDGDNSTKELVVEELDLELRLGQVPWP